MSDSVECNLLGAVLLRENLWEQTAAGLSADDFSVDANRRIYRAIAAVVGRGDPLSELTVVQELQKTNELAAIGGAEYVSTLTEKAMASPKHANFCVRQIRRAAGLRHVAFISNKISTHATEAGANLTDMRERLLTLTADVAHYDSSSSSRIRRLDEIPDPLEIDCRETVWTLEGLIPSRGVTVIAGEPGCGKTCFAMQLARYSTVDGEFLGRKVNRTRVLYLDKENPLGLIRERLKVICGGSAGFKLWGGWCEDEPPVIGDPRLLEFANDDLLIIFDSLIRFHTVDENSASEMKVVMAHLRALANRGATVLVLHHRSKKETSSYRGSSDILGGADALFALTKKEDLLELRTIKNRFGADLTITMKANFARGTFDLLESAPALSHRDEIESLAEIICGQPGITQNDIVKKAHIGRNRGFDLLNKHDGHRWKSEKGKRGARLYYALDWYTGTGTSQNSVPLNGIGTRSLRAVPDTSPLRRKV